VWAFWTIASVMLGTAVELMASRFTRAGINPTAHSRGYGAVWLVSPTSCAKASKK
jgi:hypothetical protein